MGAWQQHGSQLPRCSPQTHFGFSVLPTAASRPVHTPPIFTDLGRNKTFGLLLEFSRDSARTFKNSLLRAERKHNNAKAEESQVFLGGSLRWNLGRSTDCLLNLRQSPDGRAWLSGHSAWLSSCPISSHPGPSPLRVRAGMLLHKHTCTHSPPKYTAPHQDTGQGTSPAPSPRPCRALGSWPLRQLSGWLTQRSRQAPGLPTGHSLPSTPVTQGQEPLVTHSPGLLRQKLLNEPALPLLHHREGQDNPESKGRPLHRDNTAPPVSPTCTPKALEITDAYAHSSTHCHTPAGPWLSSHPSQA